jgi:hypothetical protein
MWVERQYSYQQQGLGIGLSLVMQLVELHGGSVSVSSPVEGRGSTFTVRLPSVSAAVKPASRLSPNALHLEAEARRVPVVDDYEGNLKTLSRMLRLMGHEVKTAASGEAGLEQLQTFQADVIF